MHHLPTRVVYKGTYPPVIYVAPESRHRTTLSAANPSPERAPRIPAHLLRPVRPAGEALPIEGQLHGVWAGGQGASAFWRAGREHVRAVREVGRQYQVCATRAAAQDAHRRLELCDLRAAAPAEL